MSSFPPDPVQAQPNSEENVAQGFSCSAVPFHQVIFIQEQFLLAFRHPTEFACPLQNHPDKSFTLGVKPIFGAKYPIGTIRFFLSTFLCGVPWCSG